MLVRYCSLHRRILSLHSALPRFGTYCTSISSDEKEEESGKLYDLSYYELPYSEKEKDIILEKINDATADDLAKMKLTKGVIKKLIKNKFHHGSYDDLSQLLYTDGMGIKAVENLCSLVLKNKDIDHVSDDPHEDELESIVYKRRLVKPKLNPHIIKNMQTLVSLHVTAGFLAWTKFDHNGKVLDLYSEELLNSDMRFDAPKIYEKVAGVAKRIPLADLYVWEDKNSHGHLHKASLGVIIISLQLAQIKGILTALLNSRHEDEGSRLIHVRDILVSKLFKLQIGEERISGLNLADRLMEGGQELKWLPPLLMEENVQELYFSTDKIHRRYVATSLFVGIAFYQAVLQHNKNALSIVWR
ncbi:transcription elongation factor, mitochondrial isoform X1 [Panulirus ornatus]|uniref:transcription elongation factor, mitochondrial isoform X1 n=1 Tax=Panulirus ornatus TaxID=150431 RepID=UPI003A870C5F